MGSAGEWARGLWNTGLDFPGVTFHRLAGWIQIRRDEVGTVSGEINMVRASGSGRPLDILRRPNEFSEGAFEMLRHAQGATPTALCRPIPLISSRRD
jgi:hypothetical protein